MERMDEIKGFIIYTPEVPKPNKEEEQFKDGEQPESFVNVGE
jgi:hypothetical protein